MLRPPRGGGRVRFYAQLAPRPFPQIVAEVLALDPGFVAAQRSAIQRAVTLEGEYGASLELAGTHDGRPARRWIAAVFVDSFVAALDGAEVVGKSELWVYHTTLRRVLVYPPSGKRHACAGTLAYRRAYWEANPFPDVRSGEEPGFLQDGNAPLRQLPQPPHRVTLCIAHGGNSVSKRTDLPAAPLPLQLIVEDPEVRGFYESLSAPLA